MIFDDSPIVRRGIHWEARSGTAVHADDDRILSGSAVPWFHFAAHKFLHILKAFNGIHHLVSGLVFFDQPIHQVVDLRPVVRIDEGIVRFVMFEMILLDHRRLVEMIIRRNAVIAGDLRQLLHIFHVVAADVDVEKHGASVLIFSAHQVIEILSLRSKRLRQPRLLIDRIDGEVKDGDTGILLMKCSKIGCRENSKKS